MSHVRTSILLKLGGPLQLVVVIVIRVLQIKHKCSDANQNAVEHIYQYRNQK